MKILAIKSDADGSVPKCGHNWRFNVSMPLVRNELCGSESLNMDGQWIKGDLCNHPIIFQHLDIVLPKICPFRQFDHLLKERM